MVVLGNAAFGHMETEGRKKHLIAGQPGDKDSIAVMLDFMNDSQKTIEAIIFFFNPYNVANCIVPGRRRGQEETRLRFMGAVRPNEIRRNVYWENVWYSCEIVRIKLMKIDISYTDGSVESLSGHQIHFECA
ncbi:MAG: hypothetical protein HDQ96_05110 [Lachnospiraceae bacterium]|nr:hypothetical protein [Lachnospiraceae bacterium]